MGTFKRCSRCNLSPLPQDIVYYWGADETAEECLMCRGKTMYKKHGAAVVVMVEKLHELDASLIQIWHLSPTLRDTVRLRNYGSECYITDGERIWAWGQFPENKSRPMTWDAFNVQEPEWDLYEPGAKGIRLVNITEDEIFKHIKI